MSTIVGLGTKKPLNIIQAPVVPDIKQAVPRFVWSRKYWKVDEGRTLRALEGNTQLYENAVLVQPRDYNKTVYGISSHKDVVNKNFRPPLITRDDVLPQNRLPRKLVVPRINPGTANDTGGTGGFEAQNGRPSDISKHLTNRVKDQEWRQTFYMPISAPEDNSILPDLVIKRPNYSADAGRELNKVINIQEDRDFEIIDKNVLAENKVNFKISSGNEMPIKIGGSIDSQDIELIENRPSVSAASGFSGFLQNGSVREDFELLDNRPNVSAGSGYSGFLQNGAIREDFELLDNRPNVSVNSGYSGPIMEDPTNYERTNDDLSVVHESRPRYSYTVPNASSGIAQNNKIKYNFKTKISNFGEVKTGGYQPRIGIDTTSVRLREKAAKTSTRF